MKKITLLICFLAISLVSFSQVLNQPANWPNANWTTSGTFATDGLINDPAANDSFTFDDDAAGSTSDDDIASESPIIDLTAASTAGENLIIISGTYMHRDIGGSLAVQYWDADAGSWVSVLELEGTPSPNDYANCSAMVSFETGFDVSGFTATQLSGFKYRYAYDDADGWQWGWCIQESLIVSGGSNPPNCDAVVTAPTNGETGVGLNTVITWNAATGFPEGYLVSIGTTDGGTDIVDNEDVGNVLTYAAPMLAYETTYYVTITPYSGSGNATGCTSSSFTTLLDPSQTVDCAGAPINIAYCYGNNDTTFWLFTSSDGSPLRINFASGSVEGFWDDLTIYDGVDNTGTVLFNNNTDGVEDLSGLIIDSTGDSLFVEVNSDGIFSCATGQFLEWDFTVACATCVNPEATYTLAPDCANGEQFFIDVDVTSLGSATSLDITDNQGSPAQTVSATGVVQMGVYPNGTGVVITIANNDDSNCVITSATINLPFCNDVCDFATPIACDETVSGSTVDASSIDEPANACGTGGGAPGVWYSFEGNGDLVTFSLCNSTYDTKIQVWEGDCSALSCVTGVDDTCGLQSEVQFISTPGTTYYVYVFGFGTSTGDYTMEVTCVEPPTPPANDECATAETFLANEDGTCTEFASGTVFGATASSQGNGCNGSADDDVWYQFEAVSVDHAIVINNATGGLSIGLYEGDCNALTQVACGPAFGAPEIIANGLTVGNTYFVRVYSTTVNPLQDITFDLCVFTIPPPIYASTTDFTVEELIEDVLVDSECNQVFNITWSTGTDFGSTNGIGYFERNGSAWPFESGLIMTTGNADNAPGPEAGTLSDGGWPGDADLEDAIPGLNAGDTNDATIIEFDFIPVIDNMSFDFIFAAEEYGTFQCTFTDAFAFLLTDASGVTTNLAIVPGTVDPISVINVRDMQHNGGCDSQNEEFFDKFYGATGEPVLTSPTDFRGHTTIMTASATVTPNELYHIKLVIADDGDSLFDSAVFIAAGSFDIGDLDLGDDILLTSGEANCQGDEVLLDAGELPNNATISWFQDGTLIEGSTGSTSISVGTTAFYRAEIVINGTDCTFTDEILIEFFPNPEVSFAEDSIIKCANEDFTLEALVANADDPNMGTLTYVWTIDGIEVQNGPSNTYLLTADAEEQGQVIVTVSDDVTGCLGEAEMVVEFYINSYCVDVPQGLSPNGDGVNDCLILDHLEDREDIKKAEIFNRYGTKVFELNDYVGQWCGTDQDDTILPVGTYFYIITFNSTREPITSWIYLNY